MPTLADIYSTIDSAKRRAGDFLSNPGTSLQNMVNDANARAGTFNKQADVAAQEFQKTGKMTSPEQMALAQQFAAGYNPAGMTVWHGSPYKFQKFDASKIGTGEGAQSYGHGVYVAENPNVAQGYAKNVKDLGSIQEYNAKLSRLTKIMDEDAVYPGAYRKFKSDKGRNAANEYDSVLEQKLQKAKDPGNLYQIDLPDEHIEKMLDWDKPMTEQEMIAIYDKMQKSPLASFAKPWQDNFYESMNRGYTLPDGQDLFMELSKELGGQKQVSDYLKSIDIPGIKYLDQGSRDAKTGTRNFVLFPGNESLLNIQNLNGEPLQ